jgi:hypothetical protein
MTSLTSRPSTWPTTGAVPLFFTQLSIGLGTQECRADSDERRAKREQNRLRLAEQDRDLARSMTAVIIRLFPGCPPEEARAVAAHTSVRGSGRVGRTSAGRALEEDALTAAVIAAARQAHPVRPASDARLQPGGGA